MTTRMQQRRGTAAEWLSIDPVLAEGELGYETDTGEFRVGDGVSAWSELSPFKNLQDLGGNLDDYIPLTQKGNPEGVATLDVDGQVPASQLANATVDLTGYATETYVNTAVSNLVDAAPGALDTLNELAAAIGDDASFITTIGTNISNAEQAAKDYADGLASNYDAAGAATTAENNANSYTDSKINDSITSSTKTWSSSKINSEITESPIINNPTFNVVSSGTSSATEVGSTPWIGYAMSAQFSSGNNYYIDVIDSSGDYITANLSGADFVELVRTDGSSSINNQQIELVSVSATMPNHYQMVLTTTDSTQQAELSTLSGMYAVTAIFAGTSVTTTVSANELVNLDGITSNIQSQINEKASSTDLSNHSSDTTNVHGIADTSALALTADVDSALDLKANLASPSLTGTTSIEDLIVSGDLTVSGTTTTVSTQDLVVTDPLIYVGEDNQTNLVDLGVVASFNDGTYQHTGLARDASDNKWKLFKGVTDEPSTTINFAQGSLDDLAVGSISATSAIIGDVSNIELQYLNGVTSAVQGQIDEKAPIDSPTFTGNVTLPSTTSIGNVSATEIGYLDGVTSGIQTQLDAKAESNSPTFTGLTDFQGVVDFSEAVVVGIDSLPEQAGNAGKYLSTNGTTASWQEAATQTPHPFAMIG